MNETLYTLTPCSRCDVGLKHEEVKGEFYEDCKGLSHMFCQECSDVVSDLIKQERVKTLIPF